MAARGKASALSSPSPREGTRSTMLGKFGASGHERAALRKAPPQGPGRPWALGGNHGRLGCHRHFRQAGHTSVDRPAKRYRRQYV